ncbi:MAG: protein rep [Promethearchaeota archaeon]
MSLQEKKGKRQKHKTLNNFVIEGMVRKNEQLAEMSEFKDYKKDLKVLRKSFWNAWHCGKVIISNGKDFKHQEILQRNQKEFSSEKTRGDYCNTRYCHICNSIRSAEFINKYLESIKDWDNQYFLTLTIKNIKFKKLEKRIKKMQKVFERARRNYKQILERQGIEFDIEWIAKFEITSRKKDDFHPHYHILSNDEGFLAYIMKYWVEKFKKTGTRMKGCQELKKADENTVFEVFKYMTKSFTKAKDKKNTYQIINFRELVLIYLVTYGKRIITGNVKGVDYDDIKADEVIENFEVDKWQKYFFDYSLYDWVNPETGELFVAEDLDERVKSIVEGRAKEITKKEHNLKFELIDFDILKNLKQRTKEEIKADNEVKQKEIELRKKEFFANKKIKDFKKYVRTIKNLLTVSKRRKFKRKHLKKKRGEK